jgi:hypothetical protein
MKNVFFKFNKKPHIFLVEFRTIYWKEEHFFSRLLIAPLSEMQEKVKQNLRNVTAFFPYFSLLRGHAPSSA